MIYALVTVWAFGSLQGWGSQNKYFNIILIFKFELNFGGLAIFGQIDFMHTAIAQFDFEE